MQYEYDDIVLKHLQEVELNILKDFISICKENNLNYYTIYGSLIGAVRHHGFIPWDDDIDVIMFREDYEKFLKIFESKKGNKYELLETRYQDDYFLLFGKMSLKNTSFGEFWANQVSFNLGIFIDIFVLDNVPNNKIKRFLFRKHCFLLDKFLSITSIKLNNDYNRFIRIISNGMNILFNKFGFNSHFFQNKAQKLFRKYEHIQTEYVSDLTVENQIVFKKTDFYPPKKVKFEDIEVNIPNNYDDILKIVYGDYMKIPPEEERINHILYNIDFGDY